MQFSFGQRLAAARRRAGYRSQEQLAAAVGVSGRTIRNYELDRTQPDVATLTRLGALLGDLSADADPVETAVRSSPLTEDRQYLVLATYKRVLREQLEQSGPAELGR